jgi:hypothetical protein
MGWCGLLEMDGEVTLVWRLVEAGHGTVGRCRECWCWRGRCYAIAARMRLRRDLLCSLVLWLVMERGLVRVLLLPSLNVGQR